MSKTCDSCSPIMSKPSTPEYEATWLRIFKKEEDERREPDKR